MTNTHTTEHTMSTPTTTWRIASFHDLRPMNHTTGKREPLDTDDDAAECMRCGRLHVRVYTLRGDDGSEATVGETCAKRLAFEDGTLDDFDTTAKQARRAARTRDDEAREDWIRATVSEAIDEALGRPVTALSIERKQWADGPKGINARVTLATPAGEWTPTSAIKAWEHIGSPWDETIGERTDEALVAVATRRYRRAVIDEALRAAGLRAYDAALVGIDIAGKLHE